MTNQSMNGLKLILTLSLVSIVVLTGCGGSNTPAGAYRSFLSSIQKGDLDGAANIISPKGVPPGMDTKAMVNVVAQAAKAKGGIKNYTVDDDGIQGDTGFVKFVINFGDGTSVNERQKLQKSADGKWQLQMGE